jgi:hypothetical protein
MTNAMSSASHNHVPRRSDVSAALRESRDIGAVGPIDRSTVAAALSAGGVVALPFARDSLRFC